MTRLTVHGDPGEEFIVRGHNEVTETDEDKIVFYKDVTKVHVVPERTTFTIQVIIPNLVVEMDFADATSIRDALALFEAKRVLEVHSKVPGSVRLMPSNSEAAER